ncbi:MAG TPA: metallopeptidase TldD-related protein [Acidimicrobiia bacterium]|nr:metallopeptidase TldD-related protein [Acidimicrobiia bacterium]
MVASDLEAIAVRVCDLAGQEAEAECRVTRTRAGLTRFANSHIHQHHGEDTTGVALRLAVDGRVSAATTVGFDDAGLDRLVEETLAAARLHPIDPHWPGVTGPTEHPKLDKTDPSTIDARPEERAEQVATFVGAGDGLTAAGFLETNLTEMAVATSRGLVVSGRATRAVIDGIHQTGESAGNGHQTDIAFSALDGAAAGRRAAGLAERGKGAIDVEPGRYEVVLAPECVATIAAFLAVYGFGGRAYHDEQSFVALGSQQFDRSFDLVDDPSESRTVAMGFDAEGTPKGRLPLVEDGVCRAIAHDRRTAAMVGHEPNGHAFPGSFFGPIPSSMVIRPGEASSEELIAGVERGIYVSTFNYCRILDPRTQVVTGLTRNGTFLIEGGQISRPLSNLRFTQSFVEALGPGNLLAVGNDDRLADSEFGPGFVVAPSMRLASWNFTGGAQG